MRVERNENRAEPGPDLGIALKGLVESGDFCFSAIAKPFKNIATNRFCYY